MFFKMKEIHLNRGYVTLVDDEDFELLSKHKWHVCFGHNDTAYAAKKTRKGGKIFMHRMILGLTSPNIMADHKNGNGLDNQRHNLRPATRSQNQWNKPCRKDSRTGFKGVTPRGKKWSTRIIVDKKTIHLGVFFVLEDAARAYDAAATIHHKEFAYLNFPNE